ncbi:MAG: hypothetical protein KGL11_12455 [Alphaproteobacteria bacterium]|nr:hypothetical protein [Alphaproteobacteria bacterium]
MIAAGAPAATNCGPQVLAQTARQANAFALLDGARLLPLKQIELVLLLHQARQQRQRLRLQQLLLQPVLLLRQRLPLLLLQLPNLLLLEQLELHLRRRDARAGEHENQDQPLQHSTP